jgi:hypothetical protein
MIMTVLNYSLIASWLIWMALLVACRVTYAQLRQRLVGADSHTWEGLRARDELDFKEPVRWYLRIRRYVRQRIPDAAQSAELDMIITRLRRLFALIEFGFVVLLVAIAAIMLHNLLTGAFIHPH